MRQDKDVDILCRKWQDILRLNDWNVAVELIRESEFSEPDRAGEVYITLSKGEALILLLDPLIPTQDCPFPYDMEQTLVHELLHLHFATFEPQDDDLKHDLWERAVESITKTLIALYRRIPEDAPAKV